MNIPKLRFQEFNEFWKETKLKELGSFLGGGTPSTKEISFWNGNIPWISSSDITDENIFDIRKTRYITQNAINKSATKIIPTGSVLIVSRVGVGKVAVNDVDICTSQDFTSIHLSNSNNIFIAYLIKNETKKLLEFNQGTSIKGFVKSDLEELIINIPNIEEQNKIAHFLTSIDDKIKLLKENKSLLENYKKGVMQQIFTQEIRFKNEKGTYFKDWKEKTLGDIGKTFNGLTGKTKENFGKGLPYIQYKQIFDNSKINIEKCEFVDVNEKDNQNKVQFGDVFFTVSSETPNEIGTASVLLDNVKEMYLNSFCFGYRANSLKELIPEFSRYLFRSELFRIDIMKLAQGSTRYNMSKVELMKLKIKLPVEEEQIKIAKFLFSIDEKIDLVNIQITETQEYKKGLLQQMFI